MLAGTPALHSPEAVSASQPIPRDDAFCWKILKHILGDWGRSLLALFLTAEWQRGKLRYRGSTCNKELEIPEEQERREE